MNLGKVWECGRWSGKWRIIRVVKKGAYSYSWNSPQNYGTPLVNGITQCYLPPDRGDRPAFTPAAATGQVGTRFIDPIRMKGWVGIVGWLHTEMVCVTAVVTVSLFCCYFVCFVLKTKKDKKLEMLSYTYVHKWKWRWKGVGVAEEETNKIT